MGVFFRTYLGENFIGDDDFIFADKADKLFIAIAIESITSDIEDFGFLFLIGEKLKRREEPFGIGVIEIFAVLLNHGTIVEEKQARKKPQVMFPEA